VEAQPIAMRLLLAVCGIAALAPASVTAATLAVTSGADPVESIATQVGLSGTLETTSQRVWMSIKPAGATGCAANPRADVGERPIDANPDIGPFARSVNWTFQRAGSYLLCG
jgi:hypothetical protein